MKSVLYWFILLVSITFLFSSCSSSEDEEYTSTASSGSGTSTTILSSSVIAELKANLSSSSTSRSLDDTMGRLTRVSSRNTSKTLTNSLTVAHISSITTAAAAKVTAASLDSSEDLIALMPTIVEGAQSKISDLGISSVESIKVINVIVNSLVKSLDGKSTYIPSTSAETGLTANETVLKLITAKSVSQIDEAGLGASDVGSASSEIVETVIGSLGSSGIGSTELTGVVDQISGGAVEALDQITGFSVSSLGDAIDNITSGATAGLGDITLTGYSVSDLDEMVGSVTSGATAALGKISMTGYSSDNLSSMIKHVTAGATGGLGRISMTDYNTSHLPAMLRNITGGATGSLGRITMTGYSSDNLNTMVEKVTAGATGALGRISMTGYSSDNLSTMVREVTSGATGSLGRITMTGYDVNDLSTMIEKVTAGSTEALGDISMSGYDASDLTGMMENITAGATASLGFISMTGYSSDNLSFMVSKVTAGATGALGRITMTGYSSDNLSSMVEKVTAGATGALGRISMSGYDYNDLAGMMEKIRTGSTGGLANITMSGYSADNVSHLTTKINSGGSGALGDIRMTGYDHTNPGSTYTTAIAGPQYKLPDTGQTTNHTNTFGEDNDYLINAPSFTINGNDTVTDDNTLLMWQRQDDGTTRNWADAGTYCSGLSLGGHSDWRLPEAYDEFQSIVDYGESNGLIDSTYFTLSGATQYKYWTSRIQTQATKNAFIIFFNSGGVEYSNRTHVFQVRCVRGPSTTRSFTDNGDSTVTDTKTGLVWQQSTSSQKKNWEDALGLCEGLTLGLQSDWRLPNIKELGSIVDTSVRDPAIDETAFPNTMSERYWSSTTWGSSNAHNFYFFADT
jgi:hypothetical protein